MCLLGILAHLTPPPPHPPAHPLITTVCDIFCADWNPLKTNKSNNHLITYIVYTGRILLDSSRGYYNFHIENGAATN